MRHAFEARVSSQISSGKRKEEGGESQRRKIMSALQLSLRVQIYLMAVIFKQTLIPAHPSSRGG